MNYLPAENITYKTALKEEQVLARLADNIEPERLIRSTLAVYIDGSDQPYEGKIIDQSFSIKRIIDYHNAFLPRITGVVEKHYNGTIIKVEMRLQGSQLAALVMLLAIFCAISFFQLFQAVHEMKFKLQSLGSLGVLILFYLVVMFQFKHESNRAKSDLKEIFGAEIIEE